MDDINPDIIPIEAPKEDVEFFIETLEMKINKEYNDLLKVNGKLLHEEDKKILNYYILVYNNSEINPFDDDIEFNIEFIDNEPPYIQIISNFLKPTMYDFRNYFLCFSTKTKYIFKMTKLANSQIILEEIVSNIKYFLLYVKELEELKTFVYLGEYDMEHTYHINDFFRNPDKIDFFRINLVKDDKFFDKILYVFCTELYFIVFWPIENNKSLGKILFFNKLSDTVFNFEEIEISSDNKKKEKKRLKVIVNDINKKKLYKKGNKDFKYNNKIKIVENVCFNSSMNDKSRTSSEIEKMCHYSENFIKDDIVINKKDKNDNKSKVKNNQIEEQNNIINDKNENDFSYDHKNSFQFLFLDNNENDDNEPLLLQNDYSLFKKFIDKKGVFDETGYTKLISLYRLLFTHPFSNINKLNSLTTIKAEIDKIIEFDEIMYEKYKDGKNKFCKNLIKNIINNIVFLCAKFSELLYEEDKIKYYLELMRKYASMKI